MRKLFRAAGWMARGLLWIVKSLLLLGAVATLVVWPLSWRRSLWMEGTRWRSEPQYDQTICSIDCRNGRVCISREWQNYSRNSFDSNRYGVGWKWKGWTIQNSDGNAPISLSWIPIHWNVEHHRYSYSAYDNRDISIACWLVIPLVAAWPMTSITLNLRRRIRRRRRERAGCCIKCGYDLHATPSPGGPTLSRCPECGTTAAVSVSM